MNVTGTERQRAVIAAFKVKPEAEQREIADAAGCTVVYAGMVIRDYLASKAHDQSLICKSPTRQTLSVVMDVAVFQVARRLGCTLAGATAKQQAVRIALAEHPREEGEGVMKYCRRLALIAGVSAGSVQIALDRIKNEAIGTAVRAREAEDAQSNVEVVPFGVSLGPVTNFRGWPEFFSKVKILAETYLLLAESRGDVYARAFLQDIRDISDRAQSRAAKSRTA